MNTPISDFVARYVRNGAIRMHMPGHKGRAQETGETLPLEAFDITEIEGADELFHPHGIIAESEKNASDLFGCDTYYSTEGSSLAIRAMLYLCATNHATDTSAKALAPGSPSRHLVLAARNVHQSFVSAAALLDLDVEWLFPDTDKLEASLENGDAPALLSMTLTAEEVRAALERSRSSDEGMPCCVYITSPDYLGHILPVGPIAEACHEYGVSLVVDGAHGAYLKFLNGSSGTDLTGGTSCLQHPIDLGADLCCDSAHKTLPVLTGGAYLHVSPKARGKYGFTSERIRQAMSLFASTSPSWLILQSLDRANAYLADEYPERLHSVCQEVSSLRTALAEAGYLLYGEEPLKITIRTKPYGYTGSEIAEILRGNTPSIEVEFSDRDAVVLMISAENTTEELEEIKRALLAIEKRPAIGEMPPELKKCPVRVMSIREACFLPSETVPLEKAEGRVAHLVTASCPPAIPVVLCGEKIEAEEISCLHYYGYNSCQVVAVHSP